MTSSSRCSKLYSVAGVRVRIDSTEPLLFPKAFELFRVDERSWDTRVTFGIVERLPHLHARVMYESASHWRAYDDVGALLYEMYYPRSAEAYCQMTGNADRSQFSVVFGRQNLMALPESMWAHLAGQLWFPFPFDQLSVIPTLARRDGFLVHACGAVIDGKAFVFAGHSGDGKTTLSRLLASEGIELLSDERIAIRHERGRFIAYGTPWHGEGDVVSSASYPLGGAFILRKGSEHRIIPIGAGAPIGAQATLVAEFLSRSIVPYYLAEETALILSLVQRMSAAVPLQELEFSREPGVSQLLAACDVVA